MLYVLSSIMKKLRLIPILALLAIFTLSTLPAMAAEQEWTIDGDKVYIDDANAYLSATPHTLTSSGWVEFELLAKNYTGDIDLVWGLDNSDMKFKDPAIWNENAPHTTYSREIISISDSFTVDNIVSYTVLNIGEVIPDIGNSNNTKLIEITVGNPEDYPYYMVDIPANQKTTFTLAFSSHIQQSESSATFFFNRDKVKVVEGVEYYPDWVDSTLPIETVNHDYQGMTTWKVAKNISVKAGKTCNARVWVEIPFTGLEEYSGKYYYGAKPSNETIQGAIASGHAYLLDPWYNAGWAYRKKVTLTGTVDGAQTDYQMRLNVHKGAGVDAGDDVYLDGNCQDDFDDIRFTKSDGDTLLDYWVEDYTAGTTATVWVEFDSIPISPNTADFYIYYGNAGASTASDGEATFIFFDDFPGVAIDLGKWDGYTAGASVAGGIMTYQGDGINNQDLSSIAQFGPTVATRARLKLLSPAPAYSTMFRLSTSTRSHEGFLYDDSDGIHRLYSKDGTTSSWVATNWVRDSLGTIDINIVAGVNTRAFWNDVERNNSPKVTNPANSAALEVAFSAKFVELEVDWVFVRNYTATEPTWTTWGAEESLLGTVTTQAVTAIGSTIATGNGNITYVGGANCTVRGMVWDLASQGAPGNVAPAGSGYANEAHANGDFSAGAFTQSMTGLAPSTTYFVRAYSYNIGGYAYGNEVSFTTSPPTGVDITHAAATGFGNFATGIGQLLIMILCAFIGVKGLSADEIVAKIMGVVFLGVGLYFLMNSGWMSSAPDLV